MPCPLLCPRMRWSRSGNIGASSAVTVPTTLIGIEWHLKVPSPTLNGGTPTAVASTVTSSARLLKASSPSSRSKAAGPSLLRHTGRRDGRTTQQRDRRGHWGRGHVRLSQEARRGAACAPPLDIALAIAFAPVRAFPFRRATLSVGCRVSDRPVVCGGCKPSFSRLQEQPGGEGGGEALFSGGGDTPISVKSTRRQDGVLVLLRRELNPHFLCSWGNRGGDWYSQELLCCDGEGGESLDGGGEPAWAKAAAMRHLHAVSFATAVQTARVASRVASRLAP